MAHGSVLVSECTPGSVGSENITVTANQTAGYIAMAGVVKSAANPLTIIDSRSGTWSQRHAKTSAPRTELWIRSAGDPLQIGDTITLATGIGLQKTATQVIEFNPASIAEDSESDNIGTSDTPNASVTTVAPVTTVVVCFGFASAVGDTAVVTEDAGFTTCGIDLQHTAVSLMNHMAYKDKSSAGATSYSASVTNGVSPLSKAWNVNMEGLGAPAGDMEMWLPVVGAG